MRHFDSYPAIHDRDQVAEGGEVEGGARPRAIDAREDDVAVERREPSFFLDDATLERLDLWIVGGGAVPQATRERLDLRAGQARHSFASLLLHEGRSVIYVARRLGHDARLTLMRYGHVIDELDGQPRAGAEEVIRAARVPSQFPTPASGAPNAQNDETRIPRAAAESGPMELRGLEPPTSWVRSKAHAALVWRVCRDFVADGTDHARRNSSAFCGLSREFWHAAGLAWQNPRLRRASRPAGVLAPAFVGDRGVNARANGALASRPLRASRAPSPGRFVSPKQELARPGSVRPAATNPEVCLLPIRGRMDR